MYVHLGKCTKRKKRETRHSTKWVFIFFMDVVKCIIYEWIWRHLKKLIRNCCCYFPHTKIGIVQKRERYFCMQFKIPHNLFCHCPPIMMDGRRKSKFLSRFFAARTRRRTRHFLKIVFFWKAWTDTTFNEKYCSNANIVRQERIFNEILPSFPIHYCLWRD